MKKFLILFFTCLMFCFSGITLAKVPTENVVYYLDNQGVNVEGVNAIGNYAYIKLEKPEVNPKLNEALLKYINDMEGRIFDALSETKNQIPKGKKGDSKKKLLGHFESIIDVTRADNLLFSFEEQSIVWIDSYVPVVEVKYFNYNTQTGEQLTNDKVFNNRQKFAELVAQTFAENNPDIKLPVDGNVYFGKRLQDNAYCFTATGLRIVLGNDMGIPVSVEIPYNQLVEYVNSDYVPLQIMSERRQRINNI